MTKSIIVRNMFITIFSRTGLGLGDKTYFCRVICSYGLIDIRPKRSKSHLSPGAAQHRRRANDQLLSCGFGVCLELQRVCQRKSSRLTISSSIRLVFERLFCYKKVTISVTGQFDFQNLNPAGIPRISTKLLCIVARSEFKSSSRVLEGLCQSHRREILKTIYVRDTKSIKLMTSMQYRSWSTFIWMLLWLFDILFWLSQPEWTYLYWRLIWINADIFRLAINFSKIDLRSMFEWFPRKLEVFVKR